VRAAIPTKEFDEMTVPTANPEESPKTDAMPRPNPWLVFLLPFLIYLGLTSLEPSAVPEANPEKPSTNWLGLGPELYPMVYGTKLVLTMLAVVAVARGYPRWQTPSLLSLFVGAVGIVVWISLAELQRRTNLNEMLGQTRPEFNPWQDFDGTAWQRGVFLVFRFTGLVLLVPVIEEMFLRGFVMRYTQAERWWTVPWGVADRTALIAGTVVPMLLHPSEALAAAAWFGMIHWLYLRTKNIWDCVAAHAVTNLLLGIYVVKYEQWWLW
jgi:CAAX prenyl protease-like protein